MENELKDSFRQFNDVFKIPKFKEIIEKLTSDSILNDDEKTFALTCAIFFLERYKKDKRYKSFLNFAYYIFLKYALLFKDYMPLFDFCINYGYYPVSKQLLLSDLVQEQSISDLLLDIGLDEYYNGEYYETFEQKKTRLQLLEDESLEKGYIAPTSYGKSSIINEIIRKTNKKKIAIIVPTKSLLVQTYKNIKNEKLSFRLLVHDEMYDKEESFIAIFTQERALRLLSKNDIFFDLIFIDEAHNILNNNSRSILISRLISKSKNLNKNCEIIYLSPLIENLDNIKVSDHQNIKKFKINNNIKEPEIFELLLNKEVYKHNRFFMTNEKNKEFKGFKIGTVADKLSYVILNSKKKNFLYSFRPKYIEKLAIDLSNKIGKKEISNNLKAVIKILKQEVHPDFYCVNLLEHGIIYLHGKIPDIIKEYLELKFKTEDDIRYVVANSVILEGINLPIDSLFIFSTYNLRGKELTNLIGRVNRLSDIFNENSDLEKLMPRVHFVNNEKNEYSNGNVMFNKIVLLKSSFYKDEVKNPLLNNFDINTIKDKDKSKQEAKRNKIKDFIETEKSLLINPVNFHDKLNKYLFDSGISAYYTEYQKLYERLVWFFDFNIKDKKKWKRLDVLEKLKVLFLFDAKIIDDDEFRRLSNKETIAFYKNYILITQKKSLNENVENYHRLFKERAMSTDSFKRKLYFGTSYGKEVYDAVKYPNSKKEVYLDLSKVESDVELVNLAIVKLKMEDDFVSFTLNKFIVFLHDFNLITDDEYNMYVYGTTDKKKIKLTKFGLNIGLITKLEEDNQLDNIYLDKFNNIKYKSQFSKYLDTLNDFKRFEIERFIS